VSCSPAGVGLPFEVAGRAYERTSLIVTTNLPFENWTEVMGSERLTGALLDRLTHRVHILSDCVRSGRAARPASQRAQLPTPRREVPPRENDHGPTVDHQGGATTTGR
jgi:hypothetical protein